MEYLDRPQDDNTPNAHPAFVRGQADGVTGAAKRIKAALLGQDEGKGVLANTHLEQVRRCVIEWRAFFDENSEKNHYLSKKIKSIIENTTETIK